MKQRVKKKQTPPPPAPAENVFLQPAFLNCLVVHVDHECKLLLRRCCKAMRSEVDLTITHFKANPAATAAQLLSACKRWVQAKRITFTNVKNINAFDPSSLPSLTSISISLDECSHRQLRAILKKQLPLLKHLELHHCACIHDLTDLADCTALEALTLESSGSDVDLEAIEAIQSLRSLSLKAQGADAAAPDAPIRAGDAAWLQPLTRFTRLHELRLDVNVDKLPPLVTCMQLTHLSLAGSLFLEALPVLAGHKQLRHLDASFTRVRDLATLECTVFTKAQGCPNLRHLNLRDTRVLSLAPLSACTLLEHLDIAHTQVSDLTPLERCMALSYLDIQETAVTSLEPLIHCLGLRQLMVSGSRGLAQGVESLSVLPELRLLGIRHCTQALDAASKLLSAQLPQLVIQREGEDDEEDETDEEDDDEEEDEGDDVWEVDDSGDEQDEQEAEEEGV